MKPYSLLGVRVHDGSKSEVMERIRLYLQGQSQRIISTPNPEILLHAHRHRFYREVLNQADLALPDGFGLRLVSGVRHTIHGVDVATELLKDADHARYRVHVVVRNDGRTPADAIEKAVRAMAPNASVTSSSVSLGRWEAETDVDELKRCQPDLIFVGIGFPEQELWLHQFVPQLRTVRVAMAVGGTFDFWAGTTARAPRWMRSLHLEWVWRVLKQPNRILRILRAVVVFPVVVWWDRLFGRLQKTE